MPGTTPVNGQRAFQRRVEEPNGDWSIILENMSKTGKMQIHRIGDADTEFTFSPGWIYPKYAKVGQRSVTEGDAEITSGTVRFTGHYRFTAEVVKAEPISVAAGTFSTVKLRVSEDVLVEYHKNGQNRSLHITGTDNEWYAKGIGKVKAIGTTHIDTTVNGKRKHEDSFTKDALRSFTPPA